MLEDALTPSGILPLMLYMKVFSETVVSLSPKTVQHRLLTEALFLEAQDAADPQYSLRLSLLFQDHF